MISVTDIRIYPVKSLRGLDRSTAAVEPWGLAGDRRWMLTDAAGRFLTQRAVPALATVAAEPDGHAIRLAAKGHSALMIETPCRSAERVTVTVWKDQVQALSAGPQAAEWLGAVLGLECRLVYMDAPETARPTDPAYSIATDRVSFADGFPLLLTARASLDDLNARLPAPIPMNRFRPNLVVEGGGPWDEDGWRLLRVGQVLFRNVKPCSRCIVTTIDQGSGHKSPDAEPIRTLQHYRRNEAGGVLFGLNLIPAGTGEVRVGDPVRVLE